MQIYEQQYFPSKCNLWSHIDDFLFLRIDVGIDLNDDVKSLLEIFLISRHTTVTFVLDKVRTETQNERAKVERD